MEIRVEDNLQVLQVFRDSSAAATFIGQVRRLSLRLALSARRDPAGSATADVLHYSR
jgi:hypothetical protein